MAEWIEQLKSGDKVIVKNNRYAYICDVVRNTKTLIVLTGYSKGEAKFSKTTHSIVGLKNDTRFYSIPYMYKYTPEACAEIENRQKAAKIIKRLNAQAWDNKISLESLEKIAAILDDESK